VQLAIGDLRDRAVVGLEDDRDLVGVAVREVAVETVVGGVQLAVGEPFEERRLGFVEHFGERLLPGKVLAREPAPEAGEITLRLGAQRAVGVHSRNGRVPNGLLARLEYPALLQNRLDVRHGVCLRRSRFLVDPKLRVCAS
jgi:hypothetical protein